MAHIQNLEVETIVQLSRQIEVVEGEIVSKTLVQNQAVTITLFAFAQGEEITTHVSKGDAMVTVLDGIGRFTVDGKDYICKQGETLIMPAKKPHAVYGQENFKMILTVIF
ncbi:MAG: cupin domain-containing protein [Clostridiales bacterium]|nr:cupin domain-containing protein [Clostridiales bacterium]